jgi:signal transduction histidine kinase
VEVPTWAIQGFRGPVSSEIHRSLPLTELTFDEDELLQHVDGQVAEYFQIRSSWGSLYRSPSLVRAGETLSFDRSIFPSSEVLGWHFDDTQLTSGATVHRVILKAPVRLFPAWPLPRGTPYREGGAPAEPGKTARPEFRSPKTGYFPPPGRRLESPGLERHPPQPAVIYIQCAGEDGKHRAILASLQQERDEELSRLEAETTASLTGLGARLLGISLAAFVATVLGSILLVWLGLSPLHRLSDAVSRVSEKDFRLPLDEKHLPGELQPIVNRLKLTLDQLRRAFAREKQALADISHELRTPVAALQTALEVALRRPRQPEEYRAVLEECRASGQQMTRLVERLLTLARLEAGQDHVQTETVDVTDLAEQCVALVRPLAVDHDLTLSLHTNGPALLNADPSKLYEILTNLLHNAIEYNRPGGSVDLTVAQHNGSLCLEVSDSGIGIPTEARGHLFERFFRADPSRQSDGLHAGLGLAIVKTCVDLMRGTIDFESIEGQGSTFRVHLPTN